MHRRGTFTRAETLPHFPIIYLELASAEIVNEADLQIVFLNTGDRVGDQFRIIGKIQLTTPRYKAHRGKYRNYFGTRLDSDQVSFILRNYRSASNLDLRKYQVHLKYFLIDLCSGHKCHRSKDVVRGRWRRKEVETGDEGLSATGTDSH